MQFRRLATALALLALLPACALNRGASAPSYSRDRITAEEITVSRARDAYELVERLRPEWLRQRVDHRTASGSDLQTLVLYNDTRYGLLPSLRDLPAEMLGTLEFLNASAAQQVLTTADRDIGAVIRVYSRGVAMDREREAGSAETRRGAGVAISVVPVGLTTQTSARPGGGSGEGSWVRVLDESGTPMRMLGALEVRNGRGLVVEALGTNGLSSGTDAFERNEVQMHLTQSSFVLAGLLSYETRFVRLGVGPALQETSVSWAGGECACIGRRSNKQHATGAVAQGVARAPVIGPFIAELRVQRYFFAEEVFQPTDISPEFPMRRPGWFVGVGAGMRFGR